MRDHTTSVRTHVLICAVLIGLTVLTVGVSFAPIAGQWHIIIGLVIALAKAVFTVAVCGVPPVAVTIAGAPG